MPQITYEASQGLLASLGWIDWIALSILAVFLVLGLFRGFVWQLSRIATLVASYVMAGAYGRRLGDWFRMQAEETWPSEALPVYLAYFTIFIVVLVVLSIIAHYIEKFVVASGLSFYNRVGGAALGVVTGGCVVLALLALVAMFFGKEAPIAKAAESSHSMDYGKRVINALDTVVPVPRDVRKAFGLYVAPKVDTILEEQPVEGKEPPVERLEGGAGPKSAVVPKIR